MLRHGVMSQINDANAVHLKHMGTVIQRGLLMHLPALAACLFFIGSVAAAQQLPAPLDDNSYVPVDLQEAKLGQLLFYDPILSGNRETSCAACHHPNFGTSDGVSLSFGDGGIGLGPTRRTDPSNLPEKRIPRNAPGLFNLGAEEFTVLFHDGRLEADEARPGGIRSPMGPGAKHYESTLDDD